MPFTFAHPAAVLPAKKFLPDCVNFTAVVIGSMAPDFEYFIRFKAQGGIGHTLPGFIFINLPLTFLAAFLWHYVIKNPFILSLPQILGRKLAHLINTEFKIRSISEFFIIAISAVIGMVSHVLWDSFTHINGFFVKMIPLLSYSISLQEYNIPVYKILQHGSTLAGLIIIIWYISSIKTSAYLPNKSCAKKIYYWLSILFVTVVIIFLRIYNIHTAVITKLGIILVTAISGFLLGAVLVSSIYKALKVYE